MTTYTSKSPWYLTSQNDWYLDIMSPRTITESPNDELIEVSSKYDRRPDLLSYDLYGTSHYWWIFAARNIDVIKDPINDLVAGQEIYVPTLADLTSIIS